MQLSRRFSDARMQEKELNRSAEQARTRRRAASLAAVSSPHYASAGTDATRFVVGSSRQDVGRACGLGRVCNTQLSPSCPFRPLHPFRFLRPARLRTPLLGYGAPHSSARGTSTLLNNALLSTRFRFCRQTIQIAACASTCSARRLLGQWRGTQRYSTT